MLDQILVIILVILGIVIVSGSLLVGIRIKRESGGFDPSFKRTSGTSLDDHPEYGPARRRGTEAGKANQDARNEAEREKIVAHHAPRIKRSWYKRAEAGSQYYANKIAAVNNQIEREIRIFDNHIVANSPLGRRHGTRINPSTGESTGGIRRESYKRKPRTSRRDNKEKKSDGK